MRTIRWGMIGCGSVTEVKSGPGFQKANHSSLMAVMRRNGALAADYAKRHGVPRWYDDAEALIADPEVDAIYIATPPDSHKHYTLLAARAGKPVYVEKPMARNHAECIDMIAACQSAQVPLFVAYYRRALPRFLEIKRLIDAGTLGDVRFVNIVLHQHLAADEVSGDPLPWRVLPEIAGGGKFLDLASHMLDLMDFLFGPVVEAHGITSNQAHRYPAEDIVTGTFRMESGVHGTGTWCFSSFAREDRTEIVGSEGQLVLSTFDAKPIVLTTSAGQREIALDYPPHIQQPLIQTIVDELNGKGQCSSTGETAARTSWAMDQMRLT